MPSPPGPRPPPTDSCMPTSNRQLVMCCGPPSLTTPTLPFCQHLSATTPASGAKSREGRKWMMTTAATARPDLPEKWLMMSRTAT